MYPTIMPHAGILLALDTSQKRKSRGETTPAGLRWSSRELDGRIGSSEMRIRVSMARLSTHTE